MSAPTTEH